MHNPFTLNAPNIGSIDSIFVDENLEENENPTPNNYMINFEKSYLNIFPNIFNESNIMNSNLVNTLESENKKKPVFVVQNGKKKRGKQSKGNNQKEHGAWDRDNIITKIQIHFLNFVIFFLNDCILKFYKNRRINFKKFNHKEKRNSSYKQLKKLKKFTINQLFENLTVSTKYKRFKEDINIKNKQKLLENPWFKKFFGMKYITLFQYYYNNNQPLHEISLFGEKISFSPKTKPFNALLKKNERFKEDIIELAEQLYIGGINENEFE